MYIFFDRNGTIQEVINDESIRKGSNDYNKIYCYLEGNPDIDDIWYLQKNPDGTLTNEVSFVDNIVTKAIPYDSHRDMKYFQDFEEYQFYVFTLSSSYLLQSGLVVATIRVEEDNTLWALGELTFNVQANIVKSDNGITQSQYDYLLLAYASRTLNEQTGSDLDNLLDEKIEAKISCLGTPDIFDTTANIEALTSNDGIAVATDTGYIWIWNDTDEEYKNTNYVYLANVSAYYTKTEADNTFAKKSANNTFTGDNEFTEKVTFFDDIEIGGGDISQTNGSYSTNGNVEAQSITIDGVNLEDMFADKSDTYSKSEVDGFLNDVNAELDLKANSSDVYTKDAVNTFLNTKADKSDTYTKSEVNTMLNNKADVSTVSGINTRVGSLETEVDKLQSVQNVVDVVATKNDLNNYPTSDLEIDDKIQVIADESQGGASTIYNWNGNTWEYVGAFGGNSYTKAETYNKTQIDSALSDKADKSTINNYIEYDNNIKNIVDDTTYTPTGYVPTNEIYISNVEFKNIYLENLTFNPQSVSITYIYIFERVGNTITIVDTIEHNTSVVGTTSSYTYKIEKYLANGLIGVRCPIATAKSRYGNGNTGFSIINYTSGETSFDFSNPTVINTLNLPFKYIYYNKKPTTDVFPTNVLTVGKNNCNFTEIQDAIDSINDDSSNNRYLIKVYQGTYKYFHTWKTLATRSNARYISIVGEDKTACIINDTLNSTFESNGLLANLTLIANNTIPTSSMYDESEYDSLAGYALHIDGGTNQKTQLIDNCDFISYKGCPVGVGLRGWDKLTFKNCKFYRPTSNTTTGEYNSLYGLLIHNANNGSNTDMEINLYHNEVISEYDTSFSLACSYNWGNTICDAIGNVFYSKNNGFNSVKVTSGIELSGDYIKLSGSSFGNSNSKFNNEIGG